MVDIYLFFKTIPNLFGFTLNSPVLSSSKVIHKNTNVIVYSYQNIDSLHDSFVYFMLDLPFQTRKSIDFLYWCFALYLHKYGYFYLAEGRKLTVDIAKYLNTSRYSNSGKNVSVLRKPILNMDLFDIVLPVKLTPLM
jgi:hypothetical protein